MVDRRIIRIKEVLREGRLAVQSLGPLHGSKFFAGRLLNNTKMRLVRVSIDGVASAAWVRPGTTDLKIFSQIFCKKEYDFSCWSPYESHIDSVCKKIIDDRNIPLIIDAGANTGFSAIWFATKFPFAKIYSIEPDPENFAVLKKNVAPFSGITALNAALWDSEAVLSIVNPNDGAWGRRVDAATHEVGISSITIPNLLKKNEKYRPLVVKIDIEGAEIKLFRSQTEWIDKFPLVVFEPHDELWHWLGTWQGSGHSFFSNLSRCKREYLMRGENIFAFLHPNIPVT